MADQTNDWGQQFRSPISKIGGIFSGPGRQLYDIPTHAPVQELAKYPLFAKALGNLVGGRQTAPFNPAYARQKFERETVPSIAQRFAGTGDTAASSGFMGELAKAGTDLEAQLEQERAKFGQEEERLRQSELEGLLKFGMQPTSEKILMQKPEGEVPITQEKNLAENIFPGIKKELISTANWTDKKLRDKIEEKYGPEGLSKYESLKEQFGIGKEKGKTTTTEEDIATDDWLKSAQSKGYENRVKGANKEVEKFKDPNEQRELSEIMDRAGVKNASELAAFSQKNKRKISYEGLKAFNQVAKHELFNSNDPDIKDALKLLRDDHSIQKFLNYLKTGERWSIPRAVWRHSSFWKKVANKRIPGPSKLGGKK